MVKVTCTDLSQMNYKKCIEKEYLFSYSSITKNADFRRKNTKVNTNFGSALGKA